MRASSVAKTQLIVDLRSGSSFRNNRLEIPNVIFSYSNTLESAVSTGLPRHIAASNATASVARCHRRLTFSRGEDPSEPSAVGVVRVYRSAYLLRAGCKQDAISAEHPRVDHDPTFARPRSVAFHIHPLIHSHSINISNMDSMIDRRHSLEIPRHTLTQRFLGLQVVHQTVNARCRVQKEDIG